MRKSGVLMHISSLPSKYGIGTLGEEAYKFVDFLKDSGQGFWQILPIGPTSFGDSPYQSPSTYAGNPYFIDFELLMHDGLLDRSDYEIYDWGKNEEKVDFNALFQSRDKVLKKAYGNGFERDKNEVEKFKKENQYWILEYGLFMAIKKHFGLKSFIQWDMHIRRGEKEELEKYREILKDDIDFYIYVQYLFFKQWKNLKEYANKNGVEIIGDIPIYVAEDSVDVWDNKEIFCVDNEFNPIEVAGCPPDAFSEDGQLWGNPLYNWEALKKQDFRWWINRIRYASSIYDVIRIDHFRAFSSYYGIPKGEKTAKNGSWKKAYGEELFKKVKKEIPNVRIIAEDLGILSQDVYELMDKVGFPGMKVLLFAFNSSGDSDYIPYKIESNSVAYIGTHDNDTYMGWVDKADKKDLNFAKKYMNLTEEEGYNWGVIRTLLETKAEISMIQIQDILGLGNEARMNKPSTLGTNWLWRVKKDELTKEISSRLYEITKIFGRIPK